MNATVIVVAAYFAIIIAVGMYATKRSKNSEAFHGAEMGLFAIVCASAGEWLGGTATTGVAECGVLDGRSGAWYTISNGLGVMAVAVFLSKLYRSSGCLTIPGIVGKYLGKRAKRVSAALLIISMLAVGVSQMVAAGKLGQSLTGWSFTACCLGFTIIFIAYTLLGGMNSVASTNKVHLFVMYGGTLFALAYVMMSLGGPEGFAEQVHAMDASYEENHFSMTAIGFPKVSSWILSGILGACAAQAGIQPILAARDVPSAKKACIITALVTAPFGLITATLGIASRVQSENGLLLDAAGNAVTDAKLALMSLIETLPPAAAGLTLASILAAILSTISPIILSIGTMFVKDIYASRTGADDKKLLKISRLSTAVAGVVCSFGAILFVDHGVILDIVYSAYALRGTIFVVLIIGVYWRRASEKSACLSMYITALVAVGWVIVKLMTGTFPISDWFTEAYASALAAAVSMAVFGMIYPKRTTGGDVIQPV